MTWDEILSQGRYTFVEYIRLSALGLLRSIYQLIFPEDLRFHSMPFLAIPVFPSWI